MSGARIGGPRTSYHASEPSKRNQAAAIDGVAKATITGREADWGGSPKDRDREHTAKQAALEAHKREWGQYPPEYPAA